MKYAPCIRRVGALAALFAAAIPCSAQIISLPQPREGWYAGIAGGLAYHGGSDGGLEGALAGAGFNNPNIDDAFDESAFKLFAGYRFVDSPLSVELAYVDLATVDGDYTVPPPPGGVGGSYDEDVHGWQLLARAHVWENEDFSAAVRLGGWWRETDGDVLAQPGNAAFSYGEHDFDATVGADLSYRLTDLIGLRGEYDRYFMNGKNVDMLSFGVFFDFNFD